MNTIELKYEKENSNWRIKKILCIQNPDKFHENLQFYSWNMTTLKIRKSIQSKDLSYGREDDKLPKILL